MRVFFDWLLFRIDWWNEKVVRDGPNKEFSTIMGIAVFVFMNISTALFQILTLLPDKRMPFSLTAFILASLVLLALFFLYYKSKNRYVTSLVRASQFSKGVKKRLDVLVVLYVTLTLILMFWTILNQPLAPYKGNVQKSSFEVRPVLILTPTSAM